MSEIGSESPALPTKLRQLDRHYKIATDPNIQNKEVKEASAEAIHSLRRDVGEGVFKRFLRRAMGFENSTPQNANIEPLTNDSKQQKSGT